MRILLGWLLLISCAVLAGLVQSRWTDGVRAEREALMRARGSRTGPDDGWSQVIVGNPSGAEAADIEWPDPQVEVPLDPRLDEDLEFDVEVPPEPEPDTRTWQVTIRSGMVLSKLCAEAYGRGTPEIVAAVARYNGLEDANQLSVGDIILLPPYEELYDADGFALTPLR